MNLNRTEQAIVDYMSASNIGEFGIEDIARIIYNGRARPQQWPGCVRVIMRNLLLKTLHSDPHVHKLSKDRGRGNIIRWGIKTRRKKEVCILQPAA